MLPLPQDLINLSSAGLYQQYGVPLENSIEFKIQNMKDELQSITDLNELDQRINSYVTKKQLNSLSHEEQTAEILCRMRKLQIENKTVNDESLKKLDDHLKLLIFQWKFVSVSDFFAPSIVAQNNLIARFAEETRDGTYQQREDINNNLSN